MSIRTKKTVAVSLAQEELVALDRVRKRDNLTRAQALREAIRRYIWQDSDRKIPVEDALPDEPEAIEEGLASAASRDSSRLALSPRPVDCLRCPRDHRRAVGCVVIDNQSTMALTHPQWL